MARQRKKLPPFTLPDDFTLTLPFGYKVLVKKRRLGPHHGDWQDFGAVNHTGTIRIRRQDPFDEQLDTLRHELDHCLADFSGVLRMMENEYREYKKEEGE
jgi:hypothetical protein